MWLYGGHAIDSYVSDVWVFRKEVGWAWMLGPMETEQPTGETPGARDSTIFWKDPNNIMWFFGGYGISNSGSKGHLTELWKFNESTFTFVAGKNWTNQYGDYGGFPGSRNYGSVWVDKSGVVWIFGGRGFASEGPEGALNDFWKLEGIFTPITSGLVTSAQITTSIITTSSLTTSISTTANSLTSSLITSNSITSSPFTTSPVTSSSLIIVPEEMTTFPLAITSGVAWQGTTSQVTSWEITSLQLSVTSSNPSTSSAVTSSAISSSPVTSQGITSNQLLPSEVTAQQITTYELTTGTNTLIAPTTSDEGVNLDVKGTNKTNIGVIAVSATIPTVAVIALMLLIVVFLKRRKRGKPEEKDDVELPNTKATDNYVPLKTTATVSPPPVQEKSYYIDYAELKILKRLGGGFFGDVFQAKWRNALVAVKRVKGNVTESSIAEFEGEADLMSKMRPHPNVVYFFGLCKSPICIVTEFVEKGALYSILVGNEKISTDTQLQIVRGIASGMLHLSYEKIVHKVFAMHSLIIKDLASRNVLITATNDAKVGDFGMRYCS